MPVSKPMLSICVPTFNRAALLERNISFHLAAFRALGLPFEIVVVDDCSADGTADYLRDMAAAPELRVYRRDKNSGFVDNFCFAMRRAVGTYALFLGDDDLLIPNQVATYLARLEADPRLGMIQAPWMQMDERPGGGGELGPFYKLPSEARFAKGNFAGLIQYIFDFHIFPEFMIVRRDILERAISAAGPFIFWAYLYTGRALTHADVLFMPEPFARVTAISADPRTQQGHSELMFEWDRYRGGLDFILSLAYGTSDQALETRTATTEAVNRFMLRRQAVALGLHLNAANWVEAYILHHRMNAYEPSPLAGPTLKQVCQLAGLTTALQEASAYGVQPVIVDPLIPDDLLAVLKPKLRERLVRDRAPERDGVASKWAYLCIDPDFAAAAGPADAVFHLPHFLEQFV